MFHSTMAAVTIPALRRIDTLSPVPSAEVWLGVHRDNRSVPRVRTVLNMVAAAVRSPAAVLNPPDHDPMGKE